MEGTKPMFMRKSYTAIEPSRLYTLREVIAMFAISDHEMFGYVSDYAGLSYEIEAGSMYPCFRGSELLRFFSKTYKLCQDGCPSMKTI